MGGMRGYNRSAKFFCVGLAAPSSEYTMHHAVAGSERS